MMVAHSHSEPVRKPVQIMDLKKIHLFKKFEFKYSGSVRSVILKLTGKREIASALSKRIFRMAYLDFEHLKNRSTFCVWVHRQAAIMSLTYRD